MTQGKAIDAARLLPATLEYPSHLVGEMLTTFQKESTLTPTEPYIEYKAKRQEACGRRLRSWKLCQDKFGAQVVLLTFSRSVGTACGVLLKPDILPSGMLYRMRSIEHRNVVVKDISAIYFGCSWRWKVKALGGAEGIEDPVLGRHRKGSLLNGDIQKQQNYFLNRGRKGWLALPALRTVQAVLPHTALRLVVSSSGPARLSMGYSHGEKSMSGEESIGPASVIGVALTLARALLPPAQNSPQAMANEAIKGTEDEIGGLGAAREIMRFCCAEVLLGVLLVRGGAKTCH